MLSLNTENYAIDSNDKFEIVVHYDQDFELELVFSSGTL